MSSGKKILTLKECFLYSDEDLKKYNISACDVCRFSAAYAEDVKDEQKKEQLLAKWKKEIICCFCRKSDGYLKKIVIDKNSKWTHVQCMKWFLPLKLVSENGFNFFKTDKNLPGQIWTEECCFCNKTEKGDFLVSCNKQNCGKYFHTKCVLASSNGNKFLVEEIKLEKNQSYTIFYCEEHSI